MAHLLHTFTNEKDGLESYVWASEMGGYNVTMKDTDADEFIPEAVKTHDLQVAVRTAKKWAAVK